MFLLNQVLAELRSPNANLQQIAEDTGVKYSWLAQLKRGRFSDPGVNKIEKLHYYFESQKKKKDAA
jgi:transcriptional regulator with XRE-family HTH domain